MHFIHRQLLDLRVPSAETGRNAQDRLSALCRERLPEAITGICDRLVPDRLLRLERLELDLGRLDGGALEEQFLQAFENAFAAALTRHVRTTAPGTDAGASPGLSAALELLDRFLTTGALPWHASARGEAQPVQVALRTLLTQPPVRWTHALRETLRHPGAMALLVAEAPDDLLTALATALATVLADWSATAVADLRADLALAADGLPAWQTQSAPQRRFLLWHAVLESCTQDTQSATPTPELEASVSAFHTFAIALLPSLPVTARLLTLVQAAALAHPAVFLHNRARRTALWRGVLHTATVLAHPADPSAFRRPPSTFDSAPWLEDLATLLRLPPTQMLSRATSPGTPSSFVIRHSSLPAAPIHPKTPPADSLPTSHAGLVLLWPFLPQFFQSIELLAPTQRAFTSPDAAAHAALLLAHLATGQPPPSGAFLTLEKLLCGLPPDAALPIAEFLPTEAEREACTTLITAVIAHHRLWHTLTPDAFRQAWLQRPGLLRLNPAGTWILHIERQAQDVILDTLPWPLEVVRMGWLAEAVFVQWNPASVD